MGKSKSDEYKEIADYILGKLLEFKKYPVESYYNVDGCKKLLYQRISKFFESWKEVENFDKLISNITCDKSICNLKFEIDNITYINNKGKIVKNRF